MTGRSSQIGDNGPELLVGSLAEALELAGAERPITAGQTLVNFVRGFELERLVKPTLTLDDFDRRLTPLLAALCGWQGETPDWVEGSQFACSPTMALRSLAWL